MRFKKKKKKKKTFTKMSRNCQSCHFCFLFLFLCLFVVLYFEWEKSLDLDRGFHPQTRHPYPLDEKASLLLQLVLQAPLQYCCIRFKVCLISGQSFFLFGTVGGMGGICPGPTEHKGPTRRDKKYQMERETTFYAAVLGWSPFGTIGLLLHPKGIHMR